MRRLLARTILVFILFSMSLILARAQSCGLTDTFIVAQNSSLTFDIAIADYFNDDLSDSGQGLCGVEISFVHQYVENFEVTLTSPSGQSVNLIGPNSDDQFDFTFGAVWQIDFVNCATLPAPDPVFSPQWNNTQTENWVNFGQYSGSYHPYIGCLEDFNTGPVNGNWTITLNNNPSNNPGAVTFLNLLFCDSRGVECCFTTPGILLNDDIVACIGADTLLIDPSRNFPTGLADTTEFGYAYLISQNGIYSQLDSILDFRDSLAGDYQVCGFSYRRDELINLPAPNNVLTIDEIRTNLEGLTPWLCAELTMDCIDLHIVAPPDTTFLVERICIGDTIFIGLDTFYQTGGYTVDLPSYADCDSTIVLDLFVQDVQMTMLDSIICVSDSATIGTSVYYETGLYSDTLQSTELGCDSIVTLSLLVLDTLFTEINPVTCMGESILVGLVELQTTGIYEVPLMSSAGCDSIVTVNLQVLNPEAVIGDVAAIDCNNPTLILNAAGSSPFSLLSFKWLNTDEVELGQMPNLEVDTAGVYILEISQTQGGTSCTSRDTITINDVRVYPFADPGSDTTITCSNSTLLLGGEGTTIGVDISYEWQTITQGHFISDPFARLIVVDSAGIYQFIVSNTITGCSDTASIQVFVDQVAPIVITGVGFELDCAILQDTLDGSASLIQANFELTWTGACVENLVETGLVLVDCPGQYTLEVVNPNNGCRAQDSVLVTQNIEAPIAIIIEPDTLDCSLLNVQLDGSLSTPFAILNYEWTDPIGTLLATNQPQVSEQGIYELIVIRQDNFCRDTATITVEQDTIHPIAHIEADNLINCNEPTTLLGGPLTSIGDNFVYQWLENGVIINDEISDTLRVNIFGEYSLIVENIENGCLDTSSIDIIEDFLPPEVVQAGVNQFLDCANERVQLQPDSTLFFNPVTFSWSGPCILEGDTNWAAFVDCPGRYFLEVTNVENGCFGVDSVDVNLSENYSIAELPEILYLSCETGMVQIDTEGSSNGIQRWFLDGILQFFPDSSPSVSEAGVYTLIIDNNQMTCSDTATVEILVECDVEAIVLLPDTLTCRDESIIIDASTSLGQGEITYQWSTIDPTCIFGVDNLAFLEVVCPGEYQVIVSNELLDQHDTLVVTVIQNITMPIVSAGENMIINCLQIEANLLGGVVGNQSSFSVSWTNFADELDTLSHAYNYTTTSGGAYLFTVENINNGCTRTDVVQVTMDTITPGIAFGNEFFTCDEDTFRLQAFVQPTLGNYSYQWTGAGIVENADSLGVLIDAIGLYSFTVRNENNGCDSTATIEVVEEICEPCLQMGIIDTLDCQTEMVTLSAEFCMPCDGCSLQWSLNNDDILGANNLSLDVNEPGNYTLTATDISGLNSDTTVTVLRMIEAPSFTLGDDLSLGCDSMSYTLSPQELSAELPLQYEWFELGNNTVIGTDSLLTITEPATYHLLITQLSTACTASDTIIIDINIEEPLANAGENQTINCETTAIILDGTNSTLTGVTYLWTTTESSCISGEETLNPIVSCPGWYYLTVKRIDNGCTDIDSVQVFVDDDLPILIPFGDTVLTCTNPEITLVGNIPQDDGNYEYRWCELNEFGEEITPTCLYNLNYEVSNTGVYEFTVEDLNSACANRFLVNVGIDTLAPMVDAGLQDTLFCTLPSLDLQATATESATYLWSNTDNNLIANATTLMPTIYEPGWYVLAVESNQNGCLSIDSVLVEIDENAPSLDAGLDTLLDCGNEQITLMASGETASGQSNWLWSTPNGQIDSGVDTPNAGISDTAWYFVQLTDPINGCEITDSLYVGQDIRKPEAMVTDADNLLLNCFQDTILLDAGLSNSITGLGLVYEWESLGLGSLFPNTENEQVFTDSAGAYQLTVQDIGNGCLDTFSFNVSADLVPPQLSIATPDELSCLVDQVELSTSIPSSPEGFQFEWSNPTFDIISNTATAFAQSSGLYYLQLQSEENGCIAFDTILVESNKVLPIVTIQPPLPISCDRELVVLDASDSSVGSDFAYQWQALGGINILGGGHNLIDSTRLPGEYQLVILNTLTGCSDSTQVTVLSEGTPITGLEIDIQNPPCEGDLLGSISINGVQGGTPDYTYSLNNQTQGNLSFFEDLAIGEYEIKVTDSEGCYWVEIIPINPTPSFFVDLGLDIEIHLGDSVQLKPQFAPLNHPIDTLIWSAQVIETPIIGLKPYVSPQETQFFLLEAIDENGCTARDTIQVFVINVRPHFIPTAFSPNGDGDNEIFTVYAGTDVIEVKTLRVFSRWGNMVFERNNFSPNDPGLGWDGTLNGTPLNTAVFVYYVELLYQDNKIEVITGDVLLLR